MKTIYRIGEYTKSCPTLENLVLEGKQISATNEDFHSIWPCPNIKELDVNIYPPTESMLKYIIQAFPNLDRFHMQEVIFPTDNTINIPNSTWTKFLAYLHTVKKGPRICSLDILDIPGTLNEYLNNCMRLNNIDLIVEYWGPNNINNSYVSFNYPTHGNRSSTSSPQVKISFQRVREGEDLQYLQLLRGIGTLLESFQLYASFASFDNNNIFFLGYIFQCCSSLANLNLSSLLVTKNCLGSQTNASIKCLEIQHCDIAKDTYPELSLRLPSLSKVCIRDPFLHKPKGNDGKNNYNCIIEMLNTSFDSLVWESKFDFGRTLQLRNINLKITTLTKSFHYLIAHSVDTLSESSDITFVNSLNNPKELSVYIGCQKIKELQFKFGSRSWLIKPSEQ
jgi:hypothetical protein